LDRVFCGSSFLDRTERDEVNVKRSDGVRRKPGEAEGGGDRRMAEILELARNIIEAAPVGLVVYEESGQCISANEAAARITGATMERLLSQSFRDIEFWRSSGLLDAAEKTLATGKGRRAATRQVKVFGRSVLEENRFDTFVASGRRYLLRVVSEPLDSDRPGDKHIQGAKP
jgi:PAS domain S-box-containing protein